MAWATRAWSRLREGGREGGRGRREREREREEGSNEDLLNTHPIISLSISQQTLNNKH